MRTVTNDFKTAIKSSGRQLKATVTDGSDPITEGDDLQKLSIKAESSLCKTVLRQASVVYFGTHDYLDKYLNLKVGVVLPDSSTEYIDYGDFKVTEISENIDTGVKTAKLFDRMYEGLKPYELTHTYPITMFELVQTICTELNWTFERPDVYQVTAFNTTVGTPTGSLSDIQTDDSNEMVIPETTGTPAFDIDFTFNSSIQAGIHQLRLVGYYDGNSGHSIKIQEWNYTTSAWVDTTADTTDLPDQTSEQEYVFSLHDEADYISGGARKIRIYHSDPGNVNHNLHINYIAVEGQVLFPNYDLSITEDVFNNSDVSYRDVLDMVAEASGSIIYFNEDDELAFRQISDAVLETLTIDNMLSLKLEPVYGELNTVTLSRQPQNDDITQQDATSISTYGVNEFKIVNNLIVDSDRETYITPIFNELNGIMYYPFEASTEGLGYFEIGDRIKVTDLASTEYEVLIFNIDISVTGGMTEKLSAKTPEKSVTDYDYAGVIGQLIKNTEIKVNKNTGDIELLNSEMETVAVIPRQATAPTDPSTNDLWLDTDDNIIYIYDGSDWQPTSISTDTLADYYTKTEVNSEITTTSENINLRVDAIQTTAEGAEALAQENDSDLATVQSQVSQLEVDVDDIELSVSRVGGANLIRNSTGLKGSIEEWQELDSNGDPIDSNNDGTVIKTSDIEENTESGSAIRINEQYIEQTIPTIDGGLYTVYFRFKKLLDCDLAISGMVDPIEITAGGYVDETWAVFKYQFEATSASTTIRITNVSAGAGAYCIIGDLVCKLGTTNGWEQAPNEVYGRNFTFDEDGLTITSLEDYFKAVLDNVKLGIYDTSGGTDKIMALFSKDEGLITKLVAQDEFVIQRYQNSEKSTRFIPTSTGSMLVVND